MSKPRKLETTKGSLQDLDSPFMCRQARQRSVSISDYNSAEIVMAEGV